MNAIEDVCVAETPVDLAEIFSHETIISIPRGAEKREVISLLVNAIARAGRVGLETVADIRDAILEREYHGTTGLGKGLALPHLRSRNIVNFAGAIGVAPIGVNFDSLDRLPTRLIILLLSPFDEREKHGAIMARLATLLSNETLQYSVQLPRSPNALFQLLGF